MRKPPNTVVLPLANGEMVEVRAYPTMVGAERAAALKGERLPGTRVIRHGTGYDYLQPGAPPPVGSRITSEWDGLGWVKRRKVSRPRKAPR